MVNLNFELNGEYALPEDVLYVGVDGCPGGWFSVGFTDGGQYEFHVSPSFEALVQHYPAADLILVDIPIGLPAPNGERQCDIQARNHLGHPRRSSVFPAPLRQVMCFVYDGGTYEDANRLTRHLVRRGLTRQSYSLLAKIIAVDTFMTNRGQNINPTIREIHPEVCFWALNHRKATAYRKHDLAGIVERVQLMAGLGIDARNLLYGALQHIPRRVSCDDFCDALVAAITAFLGHDQLDALRQVGQLDEMELQMEMVFWEPNN